MSGRTRTAIFLGEGTLLIQCVERWRAHGHALAGIATNDEGNRRWAEAHGIPVAPNDAALGDFVAPLRPDYLISAGNLRILPDAMLNLAQVMAINFHDGPLPEMAGVNVPAWALFEGRERHGVAWHQMTGRIDGGGILVERRFEIPQGFSSFQLNALCWEQATDAFDELAHQIAEGSAQPRAAIEPQTYFGAKARPTPACTLDFEKGAAELERLARALDWGPSPNPMGLLRLPLASDDVIVRELRATETPSRSAPGTIVEIHGGSIKVAGADFEVELKGLSRHGYEALDAASAGLKEGQLLKLADPAKFGDAYERAARSEAAWVRTLSAATEPELALGNPSQATGLGVVDGRVDEGLGQEARALSFLVLLRRLSTSDTLSVSVESSATDRQLEGLPFLSRSLPLNFDLPRRASSRELGPKLEVALASLSERFSFSLDVFDRYPVLRGRSLPSIALRFGEGSISDTAALCLQLLDGGAFRLHHRLDRFSSADAARLASLLKHLAQRLAAEPEAAVGDLSLLDAEGAALIDSVNESAKGEVAAFTLPALFAAQVAKTPDRVAVHADTGSLTFAELDRRSGQFANLLQRKGVGPERPVGVFMDRTPEAMIALLAIHKAGGAHLPLDPQYPRERIRHMIADSKAGCIVAARKDAEAAKALGFEGKLAFADDEASYATEATEAPSVALQPENLAYVIYTSGSTGTPKGVLIEHRQLSNFFAGMDGVIARGEAGEEAWLAVTSLSFDISMLELFWTLCRGITVVLHAPVAAASRPKNRTAAPVEMGLFYFASDAAQSADSYRLLLEGARFADENGFSSVWTPERHFHAFGGLYPNPAVTLAALSQITSRVRLCAGSVVSPLHPTPRLAEDFALVDNLSRGRVGVSFAAGWQPQDFVFAPDRFENRKQVMMEQLADVRRLWAGEAISLPDGKGKLAEIRTLPKPVQSDIPVWLTAAGSPETFEFAAKNRCGVLTHLLGQTTEELAGKIELYRRTWREAGHPGEGKITLMLHTFVGEDDEEVKQTVREPMKRYLRSALDLVQKAAWTFPTFKEMTTNDGGKFQLDHLPEADVDAILDYSFERYYETSGLFGTPARALELIERLEADGVDEIACLIDFGVPAEEVLRSLPALARLRRTAAERPASAVAGATTAEVLRDHRITHLQCTPSLASMLLEDPQVREGLGGLRHWLVGGEALPAPLALRMLEAGVGRISNVYGPTETTVWSTVEEVDAGPITIGQPLLNQEVYVLDDRQRPLPPGIPGELYIGGAGLGRGYHDRPALTAERFLEIDLDLQRQNDAGSDASKVRKRLYRTGDRVVLRNDGKLDYLGRVDHQVKLRGHRIELGEIEAVLSAQPGVARAVVILHEGAADSQLIAYVAAETGHPKPLDPEALRESCKARLPTIMVPARVLVLDALPQTPNGKIDRGSLPAPGDEAAAPAAAQELPSSELETKIAAVWAELLGRSVIGRTQNFFDLGGHSLLALQLSQRLGEALERPVALMDVFAAPTIEKLARKLGDEAGQPSEELQSSSARADARRAMLRRLRS